MDYGLFIYSVLLYYILYTDNVLSVYSAKPNQSAAADIFLPVSSKGRKEGQEGRIEGRKGQSHVTSYQLPV